MHPMHGSSALDDMVEIFVSADSVDSLLHFGSVRLAPNTYLLNCHEDHVSWNGFGIHSS